MGAIFEAQLAAYEHDLDAAGDMSVQQIEEAISVGFFLFRALTSAVQAFNKGSEPEAHERMLEEAREYHRQYMRLSDQLDGLYMASQRFRDRGVPVRGIEKLDEARFALESILDVSPEDLEEAYQDAREGRLTPLSQIRHELRSRVHA